MKTNFNAEKMVLLILT